jgi:hypothetical protein
MRQLIRFLWGCLLAITLSSGAAGQERRAEINLSCLDLRFEPAGSGGFGLETSLILGTGEGNGEVFFAPNEFTHMSAFLFRMPGATMNGIIEFDVPPFEDENENGFADFFETSMPVFSTVTQGRYETSDGFDSGIVRATWRRSEEERFGTCELVLTSDTFGQLPAFQHTFELLEYQGALTYTPQAPSFTAQIDAARIGLPEHTLNGPMQIQITGETGPGELSFHSGTWSGPNQTLFKFEAGLLDRDAPQSSVYMAFVVFEDGEPETTLPDFQQWVLRIIDENDGNENGIPDLSDPPETNSEPPLPPLLSLGRHESGFLLHLTGSAGTTYVIESASVISHAQWSALTEITLDQTVATLEIDAAAKIQFFRARLK